MRAISSQYQNVQYLLQKTLAQNTEQVSGKGQDSGKITKKINANSFVEKDGGKLRFYHLDQEGKAKVTRELDAGSEQGKRVIRMLRLDAGSAAPKAAQKHEKAVADALMQAKAAQSSIHLVNYLA